MNPNMYSERMIGMCLEKVLGLEKYMQIMDAISKDNFRATKEFRTLYNGYYRVRQRPEEWYDAYYRLMEEQKAKQRSFEEILTELYTVKNSVEVSFASKLIATIDPNMPLWDKYVLQNLGFDDEWKKYQNKPFELKIEKAVDIYRRIQDTVLELQDSKEGRGCIEMLDEVLPQYAKRISDTKKMDFIIWSMR